MKLKKGRKSRKMRGSRTCGYAAKKHKGKGTRGGKGMAGTGKRADQKKTFVLKYMYPYFGKRGFTSRPTKIRKNEVINAGDIQKKYKAGEVDLSEYKVLGEGEVKDKFIVKAKSFSKQAREKIEKAGGKVIILEKKEEKAE
ncbi:MAG: uL15m family ribosomal protein [Nanoarchaeota archaeon]